MSTKFIYEILFSDKKNAGAKKIVTEIHINNSTIKIHSPPS